MKLAACWIWKLNTLISQIVIVRHHWNICYKKKSLEIGMSQWDNFVQKIKSLYSSTPQYEQIEEHNYAALRLDRLIDLPPQSLETVERDSPCCSGNSSGRERGVARGVFNNNLVPIQYHLETIFYQISEAVETQAKLFCLFSSVQVNWPERTSHGDSCYYYLQPEIFYIFPKHKRKVV